MLHYLIMAPVVSQRGRYLPRVRNGYRGLNLETCKGEVMCFQGNDEGVATYAKVIHSKRLAVLGKKTTTCMQPCKDIFEKGFQLLKEYARKQSFVCLNAAFQSDLMWWHPFLEIGMMDNSVDCSTSINLHTDMSGSLWL